MNEVNYFGKTIYITNKSVSYNGSFYMGKPENEDTLKSFISMLPENATVLDIGACTGSYALIDLIRPDVSIYSFEPSKAYKELVKNIKLNKSKTKAFNLAVSDYSGYGVFNEVISDGSVALSILDGQPQESKETTCFYTDVITIDTFCFQLNLKPSAIKIDVEGSELHVLRGAVETIKKFKPIVFCEYSQENCNQYGYPRDEIIYFLTNLGYSMQVVNNVDLVAYEEIKHQYKITVEN